MSGTPDPAGMDSRTTGAVAKGRLSPRKSQHYECLDLGDLPPHRGSVSDRQKWIDSARLPHSVFQRPWGPKRSVIGAWLVHPRVAQWLSEN